MDLRCFALLVLALLLRLIVCQQSATVVGRREYGVVNGHLRNKTLRCVFHSQKHVSQEPVNSHWPVRRANYSLPLSTYLSQLALHTFPEEISCRIQGFPPAFAVSRASASELRDSIAMAMLELPPPIKVSRPLPYPPPK